MKNDRFSFRVSDQCNERLTVLLAEDLARSTKLGIKPRTRTDVIEDAIHHYYISCMGHTLGDPMLERIQLIVQESLLNTLKPLVIQSNANYEELLIVKEYAKLISKGFNWNVPVEEIVSDDPSYAGAVRDAALTKSLTKNEEGE